MKRVLKVVAFASFVGLQVFAQTQVSAPPKKLANFGTLDGDAQLLPGGIVVVSEDNSKNQYSYQGQSFVRVPFGLSPDLSGWKSFDWDGVDYLDQVDKLDFDPDIKPLLPTGSKVKKVLDMPSSRSKGRFVLICYSLPTTEPNTGSNHTDLFLVGLDKIEGGSTNPYSKRWSVKLASGYSYGNFTLERVPKAGLLGVLYSAGVGGSGVSRDLDIYRIIP